MLELDLFISEEMMAAPQHPLEKNIELPLPNFQQPKEEIWAIQQRDRIPGVVTCYDLKFSRPLDLSNRSWA